MGDLLTIDTFNAAALAAIDAFGLDVRDVRPISKSENVVFRIEEAQTGQLYALRLHRPGYNALDTLVSERAWTSALAGAGMIVPTGRRAKNGDWYVPVETPDAAQWRYAGVTVWHHGRTVKNLIGTERGPETWPWFRRMGELLGDLHTNTERWTIPSGFVRHGLDIAGLTGEKPFWGRFWESACLDADERNLLGAAREWVIGKLADLQREEAPFGLIHADGHLDNVLISGDRLGLIDFDDCAFGWHVFDFAVSLHSSWSSEHFGAIRDQFLAGYASRRPLPRNVVEQLDLFLLVRSLMLVSWREMRPDIAGNTQKSLWMPKLVRDVQHALNNNPI